jgi:hypothetical protein
MITLNSEQNYYILVDEQGGRFGGGRILEGEKEVFEQFQEWAESDEMENFEDYTFADLIEVWTINIKKYNGKDFIDLTTEELNTKQND